MEFRLLKRRRLLLLFLLGVGVPSLALSLLALRGIQNELALLEQRRLEEHRAVAETISDTVGAHIGFAERAFSEVVTGQNGAPSPSLILRLDSLQSRLPLIETTFLMDGSGGIEFPTTDLLFRADGGAQSEGAPVWAGPAAEHMRTAQRNEFQQNRYGEALTSYQRAFEATSDSVLRGEALLAITRVQRKAGRPDEALRACERLMREFDGVRTADGMPLGAIALLEKGGLLGSTGDSLAALGTLVDLHERLGNGRWSLERAQYDFLSTQVLSSVRELSAAITGPIADSLAEAFEASSLAERARKEKAERVLHFQESAGGDLLARIRGEPGGLERFPQRISLETGGQNFLVSLVREDETGSRTWGLLLDAGYLGDTLLRPALESQIDSAAANWIVRGRDGSAVLAGAEAPSGPLALNAPMEGNFPPWLIEVYPRPQSGYRLLLASGQSIYLYMFLAIAIILGFGLVLTVRAVTQELELARLKSDFVSTVSHEFKSPLTSIRQLSEMLQGGRVPSEERRQHYYDVLVEQSSRLSSLVTNVLDLARIEEGRREFRFEPVDLGEVIKELSETTQHRVGHEGFDLTVSIPEALPNVRADPEGLRQAISNLLNNAIQYSGEARQVRITVSAEGEMVKVAVEDFGVGISEEEIGKVFDRFYRGSDEVTRSVRGSGLGLTLVREIVDAHQGKLEVASEVGKGSTFNITIPSMKESNDG